MIALASLEAAGSDFRARPLSCPAFQMLCAAFSSEGSLPKVNSLAPVPCSCLARSGNICWHKGCLRLRGGENIEAREQRHRAWRPVSVAPGPHCCSEWRLDDGANAIDCDPERAVYGSTSGIELYSVNIRRRGRMPYGAVFWKCDGGIMGKEGVREVEKMRGRAHDLAYRESETPSETHTLTGTHTRAHAHMPHTCIALKTFAKLLNICRCPVTCAIGVMVKLSSLAARGP